MRVGARYDLRTTACPVSGSGDDAPMTAVDTAGAPPNALMPGDLMSRRQRLRLILVLGSLIALGPLTIDMYLPALPAIVDDLATSSSTVQLTLTGTLVGLALGQLVIGPLSDALGRRRPLIAGTALHIVASLGCALAPNIAVLGALRVVQGLGRGGGRGDRHGGGTRPVQRLVLRPTALPPAAGDERRAHPDPDARQRTAALDAVAGHLRGADGLRRTADADRHVRPVGDAATRASPARRCAVHRPALPLAAARPRLRRAGAGGGAGHGGDLRLRRRLLVRDAGTVRAQRAAVRVRIRAGAIGLIAATQGNVRLLRRYSPQQLLTAALVIGSAAALVLLGVAATGFGGLPALLGSLWLALTAIALAMPNAPALALSQHGEAAGTASALLGAVQFGVGAVTAPLVGVLGNGAVAMALLIAGGLVMALVVLLLVVRPARLTPTGPEPAVVVMH